MWSTASGVREGLAQRRRGHPEQDRQIEVVRWMRVALPPPPDGPAWTAVNPVAHKTRIAAGISKAMGLNAGWPDIIGVFNGRLFGIELKSKQGSLSKRQRIMRDDIRGCGGVWIEARSLDEVEDFFAELGVPLRAKLTDRKRFTRASEVW